LANLDVRSEVSGVVWQIVVEPGQTVAEGDELVVLESMKMELPVFAPAAGRIVSIAVAQEAEVAEGDVVVVLDAS
jgi:acetyl-CoA carboxylase biotin carboxyl carrier protein